MLYFVRVALSRPYTFIVFGILIVIFGVLAIADTPRDIFPEIRIPVIVVVWTYNGLSPDDMCARVDTFYEGQLSTSVDNIEHVESQCLFGMSVTKIYFQPGADIRTEMAEVTALSQMVVRNMPPGIVPPMILNYDASTVPIIELALSSRRLSEQTLFDQGQNFIRPALATVRGASVTSPYGGKVRQIQLDLDPSRLQAAGLSASDVGAALAAQLQVIPAGTMKMGKYEYNVRLNDSPVTVAEINDLPVKVVNGATIYIRDVAHVRDGFPPQTNVVRRNGHRGVLMTIMKGGNSSTLDIINGVKAALPHIRETMPPGLDISVMGDQSIFVEAAISGVVREGTIAAALTSLLILLFLGSWRSTVIIAISIPLAVLASIAMLSALGQTLNIMTLGGLALAVGILVDDATVTIENINWHLEQGKGIEAAIIDGAQQIVAPAFVSLLCICIAFIPMLFLDGVPGFLFAPMAEAVVFALIASFLLSRTLVPTMANYLLTGAAHRHDVDVMRSHDAETGMPRTRNPFIRFQHAFERRFEDSRNVYRALLALALNNPARFLAACAAFVVLSLCLVPLLGEDFFPTVDAGQMILHVRSPMGTRIEENAAQFDRIESRIRAVIPPAELDNVVDNIGPYISIANTAFSHTGTIGPQDGDIQISLADHHGSIDGYMKTLRETLPRAFPGTSFAFLPPDMVSQILDFGTPAPIDVMVTGPDMTATEAFARQIQRKMATVTGIADLRMQQSSNYPEIAVDVDRTRAGEIGITERDVTGSLGVNLAGSMQQAPSFWVNPKTGRSYPIVAQTPQYSMDTLSNLENVPITGAQGGDPQILGGVSTISRARANAVVSHYNINPAFDIYANTQGRDLGGVTADIQSIIDAAIKDRPKGTTVRVLGQSATMKAAFSGLFFDLAEAIVLIYLIIVVNFQSWSDPFVIITALPAALAGIVWMLFATQGSLSVPALTGAIMCMGIATANSVLVVSFAREQLLACGDAIHAALEAGSSRLRPVLMTALAMMIGMAPMALGLGEGGEQNAPLGRAVIGGLIFATCATLFVVPVVFSLIHRSDTRAEG